LSRTVNVGYSCLSIGLFLKTAKTAETSLLTRKSPFVKTRSCHRRRAWIKGTFWDIGWNNTGMREAEEQHRREHQREEQNRNISRSTGTRRREWDFEQKLQKVIKLSLFRMLKVHKRKHRVYAGNGHRMYTRSCS